MRQKGLKSAALVFLGTTIYFYLLSGHFIFWMDEAFSVAVALDKPWYVYLFGHASEGNTAPLYYLVLNALLFFQPSAATLLGMDSVDFIRLIASVPMGASLAIIYFLATQYFPKWGWLLGLGLVVAATGSHTYLGYAWQARYYGLWVLFTTLNVYAWMELAYRPQKESLKEIYLISSALLCLTNVFGMVHFAASSLFLFFSRELPKKEWLKLTAWIFPFAIYDLILQSWIPSKIAFIWPGVLGFRPLVMAHAKWWMIALLLGVLIGLIVNKKWFTLKTVLKGLLVTAFTVSVVMVIFWARQPDQTSAVFPLPNRYFIYLFPQLAIIFLIGLRDLPRNMKIGATLAALVFGGMIIPQITYPIIHDGNLSGTAKAFLKPTFEKAGETQTCLVFGPGNNLTDPAQWIPYGLEIRARNQFLPWTWEYTKPHFFTIRDEPPKGLVVQDAEHIRTHAHHWWQSKLCSPHRFVAEYYPKWYPGPFPKD